MIPQAAEWSGWLLRFVQRARGPVPPEAPQLPTSNLRSYKRLPRATHSMRHAQAAAGTAMPLSEANVHAHQQPPDTCREDIS
ncbi:hypothetical protein VTH06DRAFT_8438 [Thermothelomyces fergusii]